MDSVLTELLGTPILSSNLGLYLANGGYLEGYGPHDIRGDVELWSLTKCQLESSICGVLFFLYFILSFSLSISLSLPSDI